MSETAGRFVPRSEAAEQWQEKVAAFEDKHGRVTAATGDKQSGPDFESEGLARPRDTPEVVAVHPQTDELGPCGPCARPLRPHGDLPREGHG